MDVEPHSMRWTAGSPDARVYGHHRWLEGLTTERASRPPFRREVWKTTVLSSRPPSPGHATTPSLEWEPLPPDRLSTGVERSCGIGMERIAGDTAALEAWSGVLTRARSELQDTTIVMWFADVVPVSLEEEVLTLSVPSPLVRERLQHNHLSLIENAAAGVCGHPVKIEFLVDEGMRHPLTEATEVLPHPDVPAAAPAAPAVTGPMSLGAP